MEQKIDDKYPDFPMSYGISSVRSALLFGSHFFADLREISANANPRAKEIYHTTDNDNGSHH